jgi:DNA-binding response OmpR family regulator
MKQSSIILLIENDQNYTFTLEQAFREASIRNPLKIVRYANEAILYLRGVGIYGDRRNYPLPALILLDMTNPDGCSLAVLQWARQQETLRGVPILVITAGSCRQAQRSMRRIPEVYVSSRHDLRDMIGRIHQELLNDSAVRPTIAHASRQSAEAGPSA